jgi:hypothetical protein
MPSVLPWLALAAVLVAAVLSVFYAAEHRGGRW